MQRVANARPPAKKRQVRFPGLITAAEKLGVHRNHLYMVLDGRRKSASLLAKYYALPRKHGGPAL